MDKVEDLHSALSMWPTAVEHFSFHIVQILSSPIFLIYVYMCINIYVCMSAQTHICIKSKHLELKNNPNSAVTHKPDLPGSQDLTLFLTVWLLWILMMRKQSRTKGALKSCKKCKAADKTGHYILYVDVIKLPSFPQLMPLPIIHLSPH